MWTALKAITSDYLNYFFAFLAVIVLFIACLITYKLTDGSWQKKWDDEQIAVANATLAADQKNRKIEQDSQNAIDKISQEAQGKIDAAKLAAKNAADSVVSANASVERLRKQINDAITAGATAQDSGAPVTGKTAAQAVNLLADVLRKSLQRNQELASFGDEAWERGLTCEKSYDALAAAMNGVSNGSGPVTSIAK